MAAAGLEHMTTRIWDGRLESTAMADLITNTEFSLDKSIYFVQKCQNMSETRPKKHPEIQVEWLDAQN